MERLILVHYNELGLKKGNRDYFEKRLCHHIRAALRTCGGLHVRRISGRLLVDLSPTADLEEINRRMANIFGVAYFAVAWISPAELDVLEKNVWLLMENRPFESFRIDARRADKSFPHSSMEINRRVGAYVKERSGARVDLEHAERTCWIEVTGRDALIYTERLPGPGGLPSSTG